MAGGAQAFEPGDGFDDLLHLGLGDGVFILLAGSLEGVPGEGVDEADISGLKVIHNRRFRFDPPCEVKSELRSEANKAERSGLHELSG
jgi:hypothetical protein